MCNDAKQINMYIILLTLHVDINECMSNTDDCTQLQMCQNTAGSFICPCIAGYRPSTSDPSLCEGKQMVQLIQFVYYLFLNLYSLQT